MSIEWLNRINVVIYSCLIYAHAIEVNADNKNRFAKSGVLGTLVFIFLKDERIYASAKCIAPKMCGPQYWSVIDLPQKLAYELWM